MNIIPVFDGYFQAWFNNKPAYNLSTKKPHLH